MFMSYSFSCNWQAAISMDPLKPRQVGYLTEFNGIGLSAPLAKDLEVQCPYNNAKAPAYQGLDFSFLVNNKGSIVAALQNVSWGGGVGDVFSFSCYMSQQNALQLKTLQNQPLRTTKIHTIGWWVTNFDPESKLWFEELYPKSPVYPSGQINGVGNNVRLHVSLQGMQVAPHGDYFYSVSFEIAPSPDLQAIIHIATSPSHQAERSWGLIEGKLGG
jgi:hypothetical protein